MKVRVGRKQNKVILDALGSVVATFEQPAMAHEYVALKSGTLKERFEAVVNEYTNELCRKHEMTDPYWIGGHIGETLAVADMFLNLEEVRLDIDKDVPAGLLLKWYWSERASTHRTRYEVWLKIHHPSVFYSKQLIKNVL
jgi:hypothetical protein